MVIAGDLKDHQRDLSGLLQFSLVAKGGALGIHTFSLPPTMPYISGRVGVTRHPERPDLPPTDGGSSPERVTLPVSLFPGGQLVRR